MSLENSSSPTLDRATIWFLAQQLTATEGQRFWHALTQRRTHSLPELLSLAIENPKKRSFVHANLPSVKTLDGDSRERGTEETILSCWELETLTGKTGMPYWPLALAYRGNEHLLTLPRVAIIGSRHPTYYGREQAFRFARTLAEHGVAVLSGGAIGIDAIANSTALQYGASIAVLGSGLQNLYPPANHGLFIELGNSPRGLLLSEFPAAQGAEKWNFPRRNRTIAALADFVLVIEATEKSGTLSTVRAALDSNIDIGAIPGPVDVPTSQGTNRLISEGCFCIQSPEDLLQRLHTINLKVRKTGKN